MMKMNSMIKKIFCGCAMLLMVGVMSGCSSSSSGGRSATGSGDDINPTSTLVESYGDIELPVEMALEPERSMGMRTDSFQGGIHVYRGRVQIGSLREYLIASMRNHKWKLAGEASYHNVMLAFTKPNKTCMIVLSEDAAGSLGKTQANLYVTVDLTAGRVNPFGEQVHQ